MRFNWKIAFALVLCLHMGGLILWQSLSDLPNGLDEMDVSQDAIRWAVQWDRIDGLTNSFFHIISPGMKTPPAFFWLYQIASNIFQAGWQSLKIVPGIGFLLMLIGVFLLAGQAAGNRAGVLAMFIAGCYPLIFGFAHTSNTSVLAAGFEILALAFMIKSQDMVKPHYAFVSAIFVGLAIMSERGTPVLIMLPPFLFLFIKAIYRAAMDKHDLLRRAGSFLLFIATPLVISGGYVYTYILNTWDYILGNIANDALNVVTYWPWPERMWAFYIIEYGRRQAGGFMALALLIAIVPFIVNKAKEKSAILIAFVGPTLIFSFIATKEVAYNFGILPIGAAITGAGIMMIKKAPFKKVAILTVVIMAALTGFVSATGIGYDDNEFSWRGRFFYLAFGRHSDILHGPPTTDVPLKEGAKIMIDTVPYGGFMAVAIPDESLRPMAWALMIQVAAHRFDMISIFVPGLPGSDKSIVALSPTGPITRKWYASIREVCSFSDFGVCDPTTDPGMISRIDKWFLNIQVKILKSQKWQDKDVLLGVYK